MTASAECNNALTSWKSLDSKVKGRFRSAKTHIEKGVEQIVNSLDARELIKLQKDVDGSRCSVLPIESLETIQKRFERESDTENCLVNRQALERLAEMSLQGCNPCRCKNDAEREHCIGRAAMLALDIPVFDSNAKGCPYRIDTDMVVDKATKTKNVYECPHCGQKVVKLHDKYCSSCGWAVRFGEGE